MKSSLIALTGLLGFAALAVVTASVLPFQRLIEYNETHREWVNLKTWNELVFARKHNFMDVTEYPNDGPIFRNASLSLGAFPNQPMQRSIVTPLIALISTDQMKANLQILSSFYTRYYTSQTGIEAAEWVYSELVSIKGSRDDITVNFFKNTFKQPSIIARIPGAHAGPASVVILGSHIDSVGSTASGLSPGADDDGSGTVCNLEAFRILVSSNVELSRAIEFHFYAGEEAGLLGSQAIANDYKRRGVPVYGMMQLDMTMYPGAAPIAISPITDYTSNDLNAFMRLLIDAYCTIGWVDSACGYACSDHASWYKAGYASCMPFESVDGKENPYIHSSRDTIANLDFSHGAEFVKLAISHLVELANSPVS